MQTHSATRLDVTPFFDMELILNVSQEKRIGGAALDRLVALWREWLPALQVYTVTADKTEYLAVWLDIVVEEAVDAAWATSPSQAYLDNALAQALCMSAVHSLLPEIEDAGCAPAPRPTPALRAALESADLPYKDGGPALTRRYAVVTPYPFKGGCEICHLQKQCPKGQDQHPTGAATITLPGYEHD